ncbi:MAG TPA: ribose 5-phosphate isomerase B [Bacillota bacterium]
MRLAIGCDHAGVALKHEIVGCLQEQGIAVTDFGTEGADSVDYPDYARKVAEAVSGGEADRGILICGTGIGMSIAANKVPGVRAALCHDVFSARMTREHNDANVLTMGARVIGPGLALEIVRTWLAGEYAGGGRHARRLDKIAAIERDWAGSVK